MWKRKELFELLADNQKRHLGSLEKLKVNLHGIKIDSTLVDRPAWWSRLPADALQQRFPKEFKQDTDAFDHIVKAEEEVIGLLDGMAKAEPEGNTRELLVLLAEEEKQHLSRMENISNLLKPPAASWNGANFQTCTRCKSLS